jgi:hypothetical protein
MASHYSDPKDFVLHISSELINEYLKTLHGVDFPVGDKKETREQCADRFIDFIYKQAEDLRNKVFMELEYVNSLSSENHISALCNSSPDIDRENDIEKRATTYDERALLAFTHHPKDFDDYYSKANIQELGVKELTLPKIIDVSEINKVTKIEAFETKVQNIYRKTLKGEKCKIKVFKDDGKLILRAYLEDLPTRDTVFDGKQLDEKHIRKPVFDAVFVYKPDLKMLGVRALGGKPIVSELQKLFCSHFLGIDNINTEEERYSLATVKDLANLNLIANASYGVERVYLKSIRLKNKGVPHKLYIDVGGKEQYSGTDAVQKILIELRLDKSAEWEPESIKITVVFKQTGKGRRKQVSVSITPPNTCDLKNRPQDDVVRKLLKDWGIYVA